MIDVTPQISLLCRLIAEPSTSRDEVGTAKIIEDWLNDNGVTANRLHNNVFAFAKAYNQALPTLLLNSHHDTVKPATGYTREPYIPEIEGDKLYGLGSNDAGASAVSLLRAFIDNKVADLPFNLIIAITAEEEVGGEKGMRALLKHFEYNDIHIDAAIIGEPTDLQPAIAERGLLVFDCITKGESGHAARNEGVNSIYKAIEDINALRKFRFDRCSEVLGDISLNITQIDAGWQHNAIPDVCKWVMDIRTTDAFSNEETVEILRKVVRNSEIKERSTRVRASVIDTDHPLVKTVIALGGEPFVSPTTSDMSLMPNIKTLKIGPGSSSRSHRADEYVHISEIASAVETYNNILNNLQL